MIWWLTPEEAIVPIFQLEQVTLEACEELIHGIQHTYYPTKLFNIRDFTRGDKVAVQELEQRSSHPKKNSN